MPPPAGGALWAALRTAEELTLVLAEEAAPEVATTAPVERGFCALKVEGPIAFSEVGVLASLAGALARAGVSLFALSSYDTDYLLVREGDVGRALAALAGAGHEVLRG